MKFAFVEVYLL